MKSLVLFEKNRENFFPLSLTRHISDLFSGYFTFSDGFRRLYDMCDVSLIAPDIMKNHLMDTHPNFRINEYPDNSLYMLASVLPEMDLKRQIPLNGSEEVFTCHGLTVAYRGHTENARKIINEGILPKDVPVSEVEVTVFENLWNIIENNSMSLQKNFTRGSINGEKADSAKLLRTDKIYIGANSTIEDFVVIDARKGPVHISEGVEIKSHCVIEGPAYIGPGSTVKPFTHILNGCSFGPQCKLSGEISNTIIIGLSNKQHYGFLGSSYIGEWVNFGAGTTNSNLKNNYSEINLFFNEEIHCTGLKFLGVLCGDHVKTAVGTMLNTGTVIGVGANVFKPGLTDKYIPSFSWGPGEKHSFDKFLKTARIVMARREKSLTQSSEKLLESIFQKS